MSYNKHSVTAPPSTPITTPYPRTSYVDVTWGGALGDGSTDDTAAIQAVINAAATGSQVIFPKTASYYKITSAITITKALTITGPGTITQATTNTAGFVVTASNVTIDGLTLNGFQSATYSGHSSENAIYAHGTFSAGIAPTYINNLTIKNNTITGWGAAGIQANYINGFKFTNNKISTLPYAGIVVLSGNDGDISGNTLSGFSGTGVGGNNAYGILMSRETGDAGNLVSQPRSFRISCTNNSITTIPTWVGIDTHSGAYITIANNMISGTYYGITAGSSKDSAGVNYTYAPLGISIVGNVLDSAVSNGSAGNGISLTGAVAELATGSIVGNVVQAYGTQTSANDGAVLAYNTTGMTISGNAIKEASPNGIYLTQNNYGATVSGNAITDVWTNSVGVGGVNGIITPGADHNELFIGDNVIRQISKSATYLLNTASGVAIRLGSGVSNAVTLGFNSSNATNYLVDSGGIISSTIQNYGLYSGAGAPTISAPKGSIYLRTDGSSTTTRAYINTNGSTSWTSVTTAT